MYSRKFRDWYYWIGPLVYLGWLWCLVAHPRMKKQMGSGRYVYWWCRSCHRTRQRL